MLSPRRWAGRGGKRVPSSAGICTWGYSEAGGSKGFFRPSFAPVLPQRRSVGELDGTKTPVRAAALPPASLAGGAGDKSQPLTAPGDWGGGRRTWLRPRGFNPWGPSGPSGGVKPRRFGCERLVPWGPSLRWLLPEEVWGRGEPRAVPLLGYDVGVNLARAFFLAGKLLLAEGAPRRDAAGLPGTAP